MILVSDSSFAMENSKQCRQELQQEFKIHSENEQMLTMKVQCSALASDAEMLKSELAAARLEHSRQNDEIALLGKVEQALGRRPFGV